MRICVSGQMGKSNECPRHPKTEKKKILVELLLSANPMNWDVPHDTRQTSGVILNKS